MSEKEPQHVNLSGHNGKKPTPNILLGGQLVDASEVGVLTLPEFSINVVPVVLEDREELHLYPLTEVWALIVSSSGSSEERGSKLVMRWVEADEVVQGDRVYAVVSVGARLGNPQEKIIVSVYKDGSFSNANLLPERLDGKLPTVEGKKVTVTSLDHNALSRKLAALINIRNRSRVSVLS